MKNEKKILVFVEQKENARQLKAYLSDSYRVLQHSDDSHPDETPDLVITDGLGYKKHKGSIQTLKASDEEVFLPVLLVTTQKKPVTPPLPYGNILMN